MGKIKKKNTGITLIALIVTIIVMLILVAVTINMAINGGLFEKAGEAVGKTKNELNKEQELANGRIQIGGTWYDSIDDYLNNNPSTNQGTGGSEETGGSGETGDTGETGGGETVDTTAPTATISLSTTSTVTNAEIEVTVTHEDSESGVDITNCKYIYNTISDELKTNSTSWDSASKFTNNPQKITVSASTAGTYYLHVLTVDNKGNKTETISEAVTVAKSKFTFTIAGTTYTAEENMTWEEWVNSEYGTGFKANRGYITTSSTMDWTNNAPIYSGVEALATDKITPSQDYLLNGGMVIRPGSGGIDTGGIVID